MAGRLAGQGLHFRKGSLNDGAPGQDPYTENRWDMKDESAKPFCI